MVVGFILTGMFILLCMNMVVKKIHGESMKKKLRGAHKWLGCIFLVVIAVHLIITWPLLRQRPTIMYVLGFVMLGAAAISVLSYCFRNKVKKRWIVIHRVATIVILGCLIGHVVVGFSSLGQYQKQVSEISISNVNLENVADGVYVGDCNVGYIYAKVRVTVADHKLVKTELLEHRTERGKPAEVILDTMVSQQKTEVDAVSGATNSSKVIMRAVENALRE